MERILELLPLAELAPSHKLVRKLCPTYADLQRSIAHNRCSKLRLNSFVGENKPLLASKAISVSVQSSNAQQRMVIIHDICE
jgi:hypothetical protein